MNISRDEWLAALGETMPDPDPSALTAVELSKLLGLARSTTEGRMRKLVAQKKAIRTVKVIQDSAGSMRRVPAYKLITAKKK